MSKAHKPYNDSAPHEEGSATSEEAARQIEPHRMTLRDRVHASLVHARDTFGGGMTDDEIEQHTGIKHQTASARRRELVLLGQVVDTGQTRKTRSGRPATVWRAVRPHEQVDITEAISQVDVVRDKTRARLRHCDREQLVRVWELLNEQGIPKS